MKSLLLLAYRFPPQGGVGTRRWAKFSKVLAQRGWEVHVVTIQYPYKDTVAWENDVKDPKIKVHYLKPNAPAVFYLKKPPTFLHQAMASLYRRFRKQFYLDDADGWGKTVIPFAVQYLKDTKIQNLVVTGPPSVMHAYGALVKEQVPEVNLIQDYRDPWNTDRDYAFTDAVNGRKMRALSLKSEDLALKDPNHVIVISNDMKDTLGQRYPGIESRIKTIYNGFDKDDYRDVPSQKSAELSMIYAGVISKEPEHRLKGVRLLAEALKNTQSQLKVHFYSNLEPSFIQNNHFEFHPFVSPDQLQTIMAQHAFCLSINSPADPHAFGSKIFDYMALKKRILLISNGGELYQRLEKRGQYVSPYDVKKLEETLRKMEADYISSGKKDVDYAEFDIENQVSLVEKILK